MRMRYEEVEYKICSNLKCLQENLEELKNQREQMKITTPPYIRDIETKYEGDQCPHCHTPFDLACMRTVTFPRLILVDVDPPYYVPVYRVRCPHKQEHYQRVYPGNPFPNIPPSRNLEKDEKWDNLFAAPQDLVATFEVRQWPDDELRPLAAAEGRTVPEFRAILADRFQNLRNQLLCPLCQAVGSTNVNWRPRLVWVRQFPGPPLPVAAAAQPDNDLPEENNEFSDGVAENNNLENTYNANSNRQ